MAKKFLTQFRDSNEAQYQTGKYPIMAMNAMNLQTKRINFAPVLGQFNDGTNETVEYNIQRFKRAKEKDIDNSALNGTAGTEQGLGTDLVKILNSGSVIEWETLTTKASTQKIFTIRVKKGEGTNALADATPYQEVITNKAQNKLISKEERAVETIIASAVANSNVITLTKAQLETATGSSILDKDKFADSFTNEANMLEQLVDDFKYNATSVVLYNPWTSKQFAKLQGQGYQQGTNTFGDQFSNGFNYAEHDFLPEDVLKSIKIGTAGDDTDKIVLGIVQDQTAYVDAGLENGMIEVNETTPRGDVVGHIYDDLNLVVDKARIKVLAMTIADAKALNIVPANFTIQKKVNA